MDQCIYTASTRQEANQQGASQYFTGKPCKWGHIVVRITASGTCTQCARDIANRFRTNHLDDCNAKHMIWCKHNKHIISKNSSDWARKNKAKKCEISKRYAAAKLRAIPSWFDKQLVLEFYVLAEQTTDITGIPHHVDHIVPLQSSIVCGLHVQNNLRVISASENCSKGNDLLEYLL
jgi:hypothetical protein